MELIRRIAGSVRRRVLKEVRLYGARREGIRYVSPNFIFFPEISANSIVIDAGCSYEADFSEFMIAHYGAKAYAVDPTMKHRKALTALEDKHAGRLTYLPFAICAADGSLVFHESKTNESGSILKDHVNMVCDETISYEVKALTLNSLRNHIGVEQVDILKLDIEGAEYELLRDVHREELLPFKQIFIEFHHHAVSRFTEADTRALVARICEFGFSSYSLDDHNYLFRRVG